MAVKNKKQDWALGKALAKAESLRLDPGDVSVLPIPPLLCLEDGCQRKATHYVQIDFRNAGFRAAIDGAQYCFKHAKEVAKRIKAAL